MNKSQPLGRVVARNFTQLPGRVVSFSFNLGQELETLHLLEAWESGSGRTTLVRYPDFRIDLVAMKGGTRIGRHTNPGRIAVQCLSGRIRMHTAEGEFELPEGEVLVLDHGVPHDVEADEDSAFLLTVSLPHADVPAVYETARWVLPSADANAPVPAA